MEFAVVAPNLSYLWNKLVLPFIESRGQIKRVKRQAGKGKPFHTSLLHRYEVYLGTKGAEPHKRLALIAPWQREYLKQGRVRKAVMWGKRYVKGIKRGFRSRR